MDNLSKKSVNSFDKRLSFLLCAYILVSLFIVFVGHLFISEREKANLKEAGAAFLKAIEREKGLYITTFVFQYDSRLSPNTISGEEKRNWYEQICLISDDPNRQHFSSRIGSPENPRFRCHTMYGREQGDNQPTGSFL